MSKTEKLRKENQDLRNEIAELKDELKKISEDLSSKKKKQHGRQSAEREMSPGRAQSVEFISSQYDELVLFKVEAQKQIQELISRVNKISNTCDRIAKSIEDSEAYSYQFNIKIVGVPHVAERETSQQTAELSMKLFTALGVEDISINDIDIAHRVPSRVASNRPNAIVCKFVRRLAKEKVMTARREVAGLNTEQLGLDSHVDISHINLYDHLTPRNQELLYKSKEFKDTNNYKYCWAKSGFVYLRKTDNSTPVKLRSLDDLEKLMTSR